MTGIEQVRNYRFPLIGMPIVKFCRRISEIALSNGLEVETFTERRGNAYGMFVKLSSGRVVSLVESLHLIVHHHEMGPTAYIDAHEVVDHGVEFLVNEVVACLGLSQQDVDWIAPSENRKIALDNVKYTGGPLAPPPPPCPGPADSYFHAVWLKANEDEPVEYYDELDADRYSMRGVRKYRDGRFEACSYASENWRDVMPEGPFPPIDEINHDAEFSAKEISKAEFEAVWGLATRSPCP